LLGVAVVSAFGDNDEAFAAFVEAGAACGAVGAAFGGLIGAAIPRWHLVYER
jgi:hypothetical protein